MPLQALLGRFLLVLAIVILYTYAAIPILISVQAPISGLIFAFALWEAWKINRKVQIVFSGPFSLAAGQADFPALEGQSDATSLRSRHSNDATRCSGCGCEVAPGSTSCPGCHRLMHRERLKAVGRGR